MIVLKTERDLETMRVACQVARAVLDEVCDFIQPGLTTKEIDQFAASRMKHYGARSAFLGYKKFPCFTCISVNNEVVHGLANERRYFDYLRSVEAGVAETKKVKEWILEEFRASSRAA